MNTRIGEEKLNNQGCMMKIITYRSHKDIDVQFNDEFNTIVTNREYGDFKKGTIKNPNHVSVCGVGYIGQGNYNYKDNKDSYEAWRGMIRRCYDSQCHIKYPTYIGCAVCDEWHCFQTFCEWYYNNYYEIPEQRIALDKDILCKGNKIYSPDTCCFVPQCINTLFTKRDRNRGSLPIGVSYHKSTGKYRASCNDGTGHIIHLGYYNTQEEAFEAYKQYKEQTIKDIAEEYKDIIPEVLYIAMINYEVEMED